MQLLRDPLVDLEVEFFKPILCVTATFSQQHCITLIDTYIYKLCFSFGRIFLEIFLAVYEVAVPANTTKAPELALLVYYICNLQQLTQSK